MKRAPLYFREVCCADRINGQLIKLKKQLDARLV